VVPSDFGRALEGFTKMLGAPGEDGVFRFTPSADEAVSSKPEADDEAVKDWFDTSTDPEIARQVAEATAAAQKEVPAANEPSEPIQDRGRTQPVGIEAAPAPGVHPHPNGQNG
jgi:hypothetical protein